MNNKFQIMVNKLQGSIINFECYADVECSWDNEIENKCIATALTLDELKKEVFKYLDEELLDNVTYDDVSDEKVIKLRKIYFEDCDILDKMFFDISCKVDLEPLEWKKQ